MKLQYIIILALVAVGCQDNSHKKVDLKNPKEKMSYGVGVSIGNNIKGQSVDVDPDIVASGIKDALSGAKPLLSDSEVTQVMADLQSQIQAKQQDAFRAAGEKNKKEGSEFLAANKMKEGVVTLPSGLQYKIVTKGTGKIPKASQTVSVHYRGTFIDGKEFDNSYKRGEPLTFRVSDVFKGWAEALQLMPVGSKWQLFVPPDLAYGERGRPPTIGANVTLLFEMELLSAK